MTSIKEVARAAGVSTATVSRVLANKAFIRPETRERVLKAVAELKYRPNLLGRSLRSQRSARIGLVFSDIRNPFFAGLSRAVEDAAYEKGCSVLICNTDEDPRKEALYLDLLHDENVTGIIFSPTQQFSAQSAAYHTDIPMVAIDRYARNLRIDTVLLDNIAAASELAGHLIDGGYRRLGGLFGDASTTGQDRCRGFQEALRARGLEPLATRFVPARIDSGYAAAAIMLDGPEPPDGIFASNSLLAAGAFRAIRERNLHIPDDVALVGFDLTEWGEFVDPPITVIIQPMEEIGCTATDLLFQRIAEPSRPAQQVTLKGKLLVRGSSAPR